MWNGLKWELDKMERFGQNPCSYEQNGSLFYLECTVLLSHRKMYDHCIELETFKSPNGHLSEQSF